MGDAPDPDYPTLFANNGASHGLGSGVYLGACVDAEQDAHPTLAANGDDVHSGDPVFGTCMGDDDEDGVTFTTDLLAGEVAEIEVVASAPCVLTAWIDFADNGSWEDYEDNIFPSGVSLVAGTNVLTFTLPGQVNNGPTYARFRCATNGVENPTGYATDGEVEDYRVRLGPPLDLGDAPDQPYPTLLASGGAVHALGSGVYLGSCVDAEYDGQPSFAADADDMNASVTVFGICTGGDDEDGVSFTTSLLPGETAEIEVTANDACTLSAWIDFNADGDWLDAGESLFPSGQALVAGVNNLSFAVPAGAVSDRTYARFRCTTTGVTFPQGYAADGEVEDYRVVVGHLLDLGDAPDQPYPTLLANTGASHVLGSDVYLGFCVDAESDGQPSSTATGDDVNVGSPAYGSCGHISDEDGVAFLSPPYAGGTTNIAIVANAECTLSAWVDFDADGDWSDSGENIFPGGQTLVAGVNFLSFVVPAGSVEGEAYARFRCTTDGPVGFVGEASDGEVEDYMVVIGPPLDFGDAPDQPYPTLLANVGATHVLGSEVYLGACVDAEPDGQPTASADGDDVNVSTPTFGTCVGGDDEDGVTFTSNLIAGYTADIVVVANSTCMLSAWIDFNADGDWLDVGETLFPTGQLLVPGPNSLSFLVPKTSEVNDATYARFRCTTDGPVPFSGPASDGEVEDYVIQIGPSLDFGDAPNAYPTLIESMGASHELGSDVYLGVCVDGEMEGLPSAVADGDDLGVGSPTFGTCQGDDEDGVTFTSSLFAGEIASVDVEANVACTLSAWIDFNANGDWADAGEDLFPGGEALVAGVNSLTFAVPAWAERGATYARFRCTTDGVVSFSGLASDGEVEDYRIDIVAPINYLPLILKED
jgi:hypothetical protein